MGLRGRPAEPAPMVRIQTPKVGQNGSIWGPNPSFVFRGGRGRLYTESSFGPVVRVCGALRAPLMPWAGSAILLQWPGWSPSWIGLKWGRKWVNLGSDPQIASSRGPEQGHGGLY